MGYSVIIFLLLLVWQNITQSRKHTASKLIHDPIVISLLLSRILQSYVIYVGINRIKIVQSLEGRFEESVIAYLFLVNILPILIVPMIWTETGKFTKVLNDWTDFEV